MSGQAKGVLIALIGTTAWATTAIFIRYLLTRFTLSSLTLAFWRDLILALTLLMVFRIWKPAYLRVGRRDLLFLAAYGGLILALFNISWTTSVQLNGAAVATVLAYCSPAFTVGLARWLHKEPVTWRKGLAAGLSLIGCVGVARAYLPEVWQLNPLGLLIGLLSGLAFAIYSLAGRWSAQRFASPWTVMTYGFLFAAMALGLMQVLAVFLPPAAGDVQTAAPGWSGLVPAFFSLGTAWQGWLVLAALSLGPTLIGYGLYTVSLRYLPASVATVIASLEPALTAVLAIFLLAEQLDWPQWVGGALILGAIVLTQTETTTPVPLAVE